MSEDIFRRLQQRLDLYSLGFPATESGIEITLLKKLFSQKDAEMFLNMSPRLEEPESVAQRLERPVEEVASQLEDMAKRGLLFRLRKDQSVKYGAIPFMHGLAEFQVKRFDRELRNLFDQYLDERFHQAVAGVDGLFIRTVPIEKSIVPEQHVAAFDDAVGILKKNDTIVVTECLCRKRKRISGEGCDKPVDNCFMFGSMARFYIENNMGRQVDFKEAVEILRKSQEAGLVTQPGTAQNPAGMCNCCGDCCVVLGSVKKFAKPAELVFSNYQAAINGEDCTGCEICLERCQMQAITMTEDGIAQIDLDRCIGCGLCVTTCPSEAIALISKPDNARRIPSATSSEQMMQIAKKRGVI
jgi:Pyruvate/2-oxoacid:ferredoxin oxidoreductase delta subunit